MLATNSTNSFPNKDQYKVPDYNYVPLKENIEPLDQVLSAKNNGKQPDFSLYSKYLRPNYNSIKKKRFFEELGPKTPCIDVVNIYSLGIGPEM